MTNPSNNNDNNDITATTPSLNDRDKKKRREVKEVEKSDEMDEEQVPRRPFDDDTSNPRDKTQNDTIITNDANNATTDNSMVSKDDNLRMSLTMTNPTTIPPDNDDATPSGKAPTDETCFVKVSYDFLEFLDEMDYECITKVLFTHNMSSKKKQAETDHDRENNNDDLIRPDKPNGNWTTPEEASNKDSLLPNIGKDETTNNSNKLATAVLSNLDLARLCSTEPATNSKWTYDHDDYTTISCNSGLQDYDERIHWYGTQQDYYKWMNYHKTDKQCIEHMVRQRFNTSWDMWEDWIGIHHRIG
jgi:hypothetical protein